jgi:hypothetical protein
MEEDIKRWTGNARTGIGSRRCSTPHASSAIGSITGVATRR